MLIRFLVILLSFVASFAWGNVTAGKKLSALLQGYRTYQAHFVQETLGQGDQAVKRSQGRLLLKRPGQFRWDTQKPSAQTIIANGKTLWIYDIDLAQVVQKTMKAKSGLDPAALLTGDVSQLLTQFSVGATTKGNQQTFVLTPKNKDSGFVQIVMTFQSGQLTGMTVKNNLGQTSRFRFDHIQLNRPLNTDLFQFKPPKGVDVLKQS